MGKSPYVIAREIKYITLRSHSCAYQFMDTAEGHNVHVRANF